MVYYFYAPYADIKSSTTKDTLHFCELMRDLPIPAYGKVESTKLCANYGKILSDGNYRAHIKLRYASDPLLETEIEETKRLTGKL